MSPCESFLLSLSLFDVAVVSCTLVVTKYLLFLFFSFLSPFFFVLISLRRYLRGYAVMNIFREG